MVTVIMRWKVAASIDRKEAEGRQAPIFQQLSVEYRRMAVICGTDIFSIPGLSRYPCCVLPKIVFQQTAILPADRIATVLGFQWLFAASPCSCKFGGFNK